LSSNAPQWVRAVKNGFVVREPGRKWGGEEYEMKGEIGGKSGKKTAPGKHIVAN